MPLSSSSHFNFVWIHSRSKHEKSRPWHRLPLCPIKKRWLPGEVGEVRWGGILFFSLEFFVFEKSSEPRKDKYSTDFRFYPHIRWAITYQINDVDSEWKNATMIHPPRKGWSFSDDCLLEECRYGTPTQGLGGKINMR